MKGSGTSLPAKQAVPASAARWAGGSRARACPAAGGGDPPPPSTVQAGGLQVRFLRCRRKGSARGTRVQLGCCSVGVLLEYLPESWRCLCMKEQWFRSLNNFGVYWFQCKECWCSAHFVCGQTLESCHKQRLFLINPWNKKKKSLLLQWTAVVQAGWPPLQRCLQVCSSFHLEGVEHAPKPRDLL